MTSKNRSCRSPAVMRFAFGCDASLVVPREDGLDLLAWLGLDRPEFGAVAVSELAARCRRRLWPMPRNVDLGSDRRPPGTLHRLTGLVLESCESVSAGALVVFG